jgi:hypothetical protein
VDGLGRKWKEVVLVRFGGGARKQRETCWFHIEDLAQTSPEFLSGVLLFELTCMVPEYKKLKIYAFEA